MAKKKKPEKIRRAVKVSINFATYHKYNTVLSTLQRYRSVVNFYIKSLWTTPGGLDKETLARLDPDASQTQLTARYRSQALKQALEIVNGTIKSAIAKGKTKADITCPKFNGAMVLDAKFISISDGDEDCSFDLFIRMSTLKRREPINIPTRKTKQLNKWLSKKYTLVQGCAINEKGIILWVEKEKSVKLNPDPIGKTLGIDIGKKKMISTSDGDFFGTDYDRICKKLQRRKKGSKGFKRAQDERKNYINYVLNQLPWGDISVLGIEMLKNLKTGKSSKRSKQFRKAMAPWTYCQVISGIRNRSEENSIHLIEVCPAYTSQTCPSCNMVSASNRKGEDFKCVACNYKHDADHVGALNVLDRTKRLIHMETYGLGSLESPRLEKSSNLNDPILL